MVYEPDAPEECRRGHRYGPNLVQVGHVRCHCEGAEKTGGHLTYRCRTRVDGVECGDLIAQGCVDPSLWLVARTGRQHD